MLVGRPVGVQIPLLAPFSVFKKMRDGRPTPSLFPFFLSLLLAQGACSKSPEEVYRETAAAAKNRDTAAVMENLTARSKKLLGRLLEIDGKTGGKLRFFKDAAALFAGKEIAGIEKDGDAAVIILKGGGEEKVFMIRESGWKIDMPLSGAFYEPLNL